jgi:hypothetical protein
MIAPDARSILRPMDNHVLNLVARASVPTVVRYGCDYNRHREHSVSLHAATVLRAAYRNNRA